MARRNVNTRQYCKHLTNPPKKNVTRYKEWLSRDMYFCQITENPCVARELSCRTLKGDLFGYAYPEINEEVLGNCPSRDCSQKIAESLIKEIKRKQILGLEEQISELKKSTGD